MLKGKVKFCLIPLRLFGLCVYLCGFGFGFVCDLIWGGFFIEFGVFLVVGWLVWVFIVLPGFEGI